MIEAFADLPKTPRTHFVLHLYVAIFRLLFFLQRGHSESEFDALLERFPFLAAYLEEMRPFLSQDATWQAGSTLWREALIGWEESTTWEVPLPLQAFGRGRLGLARRLAFLLAGLPEEDSRFGNLFSTLQEPRRERRPSLELLGRIALDPDDEGDVDAWDLLRPLVAGRFLAVTDRALPRAEWPLTVPTLLWDAARGEIDPAPAPGWTFHPRSELATFSQLTLGDKLRQRLSRLPDLLRGDEPRAVLLRSPIGTDPAHTLSPVARALNRHLLEINGREAVTELAGPFAALTQALPLIIEDLAPGEILDLQPWNGYRGPLAVALGFEGSARGPHLDRAITLTLDSPDREQRRQLWKQTLARSGGVPTDPAELDLLAERFQLGDGHIRRLAPNAWINAQLDGRQTVQLGDVRQASRDLAQQQLETLASRMEPRGSWTQLVTGSATGDKLSELELRCRHRERLLDHLGTAYVGKVNRGVRGLFTGPSGTGKTLAARILAAELGLDLYRVDLAAVINKYIGETEKNLHQILSRAEALDVVLLLDEGDSLLAHRTEVRSSNDRYANLETNYLLQRLETFQGIVVVTTNLEGQIDEAFKRRMDVVVPFALPEAAQRLRILELHLSDHHQIETAFLEQAAVRCQLSGGQLRNVVLHATLLALDEQAIAPQTDHLERALRSEYRKAGSPFPLATAWKTSPASNGNGLGNRFGPAAHA